MLAKFVKSQAIQSSADPTATSEQRLAEEVKDLRQEITRLKQLAGASAEQSGTPQNTPARCVAQGKKRQSKSSTDIAEELSQIKKDLSRLNQHMVAGAPAAAAAATKSPPLQQGKEEILFQMWRFFSPHL